MAYQLVLQFPHDALADYDAMIALEEQIDEVLGELGEVDGHDAGEGEMNIFVFSPEPESALAALASLLAPYMTSLRAAYRDDEADDERYIVLHPKGLTTFSVA
ncbi:hypothetical protein [Caulobacter hibisci]|uniref:ABC transporter n=1 Tax=Caulobacter hibisci TaxID=2035993 RepID=A0ABS0SV60_9CAUL|nr:hypothetical protein [Caulobacter hibisci]MBI1683176.1 ABC transporter [Caulobacter hibisci]